MSEITYIIACEEVYNDKELGRIMVKPYTVLYFDDIPTKHTFTVAFGLVDCQYNTSYPISVKIYSPQGELLTVQKFDHILNNDSKGPDVRVSSSLSLLCKEFSFDSEGHYLFEVELHTISKSLKLPVYKKRTVIAGD